MGVDFIRKAAWNFHKGLDQAKVDLGTPGLFTRQPDCEPRAYAATIRPKARLRPGESLGIALRRDKIVALRCMNIVAEFDAPTAELLGALDESFGEAFGKVLDVHEIANIAEISIC